MVQNGESFWTVVYAPFMAHDLTRDDVRAIIKEGLLRTRGGYKTVAALFNVPADHRRLVSFLRKTIATAGIDTRAGRQGFETLARSRADHRHARV